MATDIDQMLAAAASGGTGTTASGPLIPVRYPGLSPYQADGSSSANAAEHSHGTKVPRVELLDPNAASVAINGWDEEDQRAVAKKMWYLGLLDSPQDLAGAYAQWDNVVQVAARFAAAGNPMEVGDVMELIADGSPDAIKNRARRNRAGGVTTQKQRSINISNPGEAKALIEQAFQSSMGRDPTDAELRSMTAALQAQQRANPTVSTQTTHYGADGSVASQDVSTEGGIDPSQFIHSQAEADPEAAEYQAGTTYFSALMSALGSGVPGA